jgi:DNA-binding winged helix-turn-helix (wHTH) protein
MPVNTVFTNFFSQRLAVRSGIPIPIRIVMPVIFFIATSFTKHPDPELRSKQVNLIIRQIGHQLLLQAGDSTSRVLPVLEEKEGTFLLQLENQFVFSHDSLIALSERLLPKTTFPNGYTVTVHDCLNASIVYGFQLSNASPDNVGCQGRSQPLGCYLIEFVFPDFYQILEPEKVEPKKAELKKADIGQVTEELKTVKIDPYQVNLIPTAVGTQELKTTLFDYPFISLVCSAMMLLLSVTLLIVRFGKNIVPAQAQNQDYSVMKESDPEMSALGKFLFDVKGKRLLLGTELISLTDKECRVLELLNKDFGELIPRETLMQKVWINEGVITGRSLDMFVSKLRKKLSNDPELRITNVHGKGYKLEIPGTQIG